MTQRCRPRLSPRGIADKMRRESEHRQDARDAQAARTSHRTDATGRAVHMVGWSSEQLAKWDAEQAQARARMRARGSWEACPVCTTQCSENECKEGCALAKEKTKVTSPPPMPRFNAFKWFGLCAVIFVGVLLVLTKPWAAPRHLTDDEAIKECLAYPPATAANFDMTNEADHQRVVHMADVCNQAARAIQRMPKK